MAGNTAKFDYITLAVRAGSLKAVKDSVSKYITTNPSEFCGVFMELCRIALQFGHIEIAKFLVQEGVTANSRSEGGPYYAPLVVACTMGSVEMVNFLLGLEPHSQYVTPEILQFGLLLSAQQGSDEIVAALLSAGADSNGTVNANMITHFSVGSTPLLLAAEYEHTKVAKMLLEKGASVDAKDEKAKSPLYFAVEKRNPLLIKYIVEHNPVIDDETRKAVRRIILNYHANSGIINDFIDYGFTFNSEDLNDADLLMAAVENGYTKIVEWFLSYGVNPYNPKFDLPLLHWAVGSGHKDIIEPLINSGWAVNGRDEMGHTPIHYLLSLRDKRFLCVEIAKLLLHNGADIQEASKLLSIAIEMECMELCRVLTENGADINCLNKQDKTPIHVTLSTKSLFYRQQANGAEIDLSESKGGEIIKLLLRNNPDLNVKTGAGHAPIHLAAMYGIEEAVQILLDHGADVNALDENRSTPLHLTISQNFKFMNQDGFVGAGEQIVELLLRNGAEVNRKTADGLTPLHLAADCQSLHIPRILLRYGANVRSCADEDDCTPLHSACQEGNREMVKLLLSNGANIEACQRNGMRPLHLAALFGRTDVVDILLEFNADIDAQEGLNETALHLCVINNHYATINLLLENGCDINVINKSGKTAFEIAVSKHQPSRREFDFSFRFSSNTEKLLACLKKHIIKLYAAKFYVCDNILRLLDFDSKLIDFRKKCEEELCRMKCERLLDQYTLYSVFEHQTHPNHMRNESLLNTLESFDYSAYPIYEDLLISTIEKSKKRIELLDSGSQWLNILLITRNVLNLQFPIPSAEILEEIVSYLSKEDLKNLIRCGENLKSQLNQKASTDIL